MPPTKKFIDKKNAVTFQLVHRSQRDPLITDEKAPQHVLVEQQAAGQSQAPQTPDIEKRRLQQRKFGVFFDDEYDYLQHLKAPGKDVVEWERVDAPNVKPKDKNKSKPSIQLPSSVFASEFEEDEGLLQKAVPRFGPRPDWDPDIVEALDDDFDFDNPDNELEDNFMEMALGEPAGEDDEEYEDDDDDDDGSDVSDVDSNDASIGVSEDEDDDKLGPLRFREDRFDDEETKSKFTEYSMSSSVIRRNEQLTLLDDRFEKFFDQYDDNEIGSLDLENIDGHIDLKDRLLIQYARQFKRERAVETYDKNWDVVRLTKLQDTSSTEDLVEMEVEPKKEKWDCESILSTYSNLYNHPKLIQEPKRGRNRIEINPKTGLPINVLDGNESKLTEKTLAKFNNQVNASNSSTGPKSLCDKSVISALSVLSIRPKDETPEERRERKKLLKEYRHERRIERKANTQAFTEEKHRQQKIRANNHINIQGAKIM